MGACRCTAQQKENEPRPGRLQVRAPQASRGDAWHLKAAAIAPRVLSSTWALTQRLTSARLSEPHRLSCPALLVCVMRAFGGMQVHSTAGGEGIQRLQATIPRTTGTSGRCLTPPAAATARRALRSMWALTPQLTSAMLPGPWHPPCPVS